MTLLEAQQERRLVTAFRTLIPEDRQKILHVVEEWARLTLAHHETAWPKDIILPDA